MKNNSVNKYNPHENKNWTRFRIKGTMTIVRGLIQALQFGDKLGGCVDQIEFTLLAKCGPPVFHVAEVYTTPKGNIWYAEGTIYLNTGERYKIRSVPILRTSQKMRLMKSLELRIIFDVVPTTVFTTQKEWTLRWTSDVSFLSEIKQVMYDEKMYKANNGCGADELTRSGSEILSLVTEYGGEYK